MNELFKILTIVGTPHDKKSNTRALTEDIVDEMKSAGLALEHRIITLGKKTVSPCRGCWACTKSKPCPIKDDDLLEIKAAMLDCDMLILASPVYTNQVTAQMKALFDRLFTWCHVFPLLGKYGLTVCSTGNDGHQDTGAFLEKMMATYGVYSFGTVAGLSAYTPGFFLRRAMYLQQNRKLAKKMVATIQKGKHTGTTRWQRRMFKVMKRKMGGVHTINYLVNGTVDGQPKPSALLLWFIRRIIKKRNVAASDTAKLSRLMQFELSWWRDRGWLRATSIRQLQQMPVPEGFNSKERLLGH